MLSQWQALPLVSRWRDDAPAFDAAIWRTSTCRTGSWTVAALRWGIAGYAVRDWRMHHFAFLPEGARGIHQYVGDAAMLPHGHGPAFVALRIADLFASGVPVMATGPHADTTRAIRAYEKAGFACTGAAMGTDRGRVLPFERWRVAAL